MMMRIMITDCVLVSPSDACDLTLDPNTANGWLTLSESNKKASCVELRTYPDLPERFDKHTQVLCREVLTGRHYWEVEWSKCVTNSVGVAVTYKSIGRKGDSSETAFGNNNISWYFGENKNLEAWHNGKVWNGPVPSTGCKRVGVYLDWPAGTLSFYDISGGTLSHLYTFRDKFTEPVCAGFWAFYKTNYVALRPL